MKKVILSTIATLVLGVAVVNAGDFIAGSPRGEDGYVYDKWDYAGVSASSVTLSSANALLFSGEGVVIGFIASSNTSLNDYIMFRATDSLTVGGVDGGNTAASDYTTTDEFARINLSSSPVGTTWARYGTTYMFPAPIRVVRGCAAKASVNTINTITYLWHKFGKPTDEQPSGGH